MWNTLIIEGLLQYGYTHEAATLFSRLLDAQVKALKRDHGFREAYNSETGEGLGDLDELAGIVPLQLVMALIGLRIVSARRVWAGGVFALPNPVKVTQQGVEVMRSAGGTTVRFPSGHAVEVGPEWQLIEDPTPEPPAPVAEPTPAALPEPPVTAGPTAPPMPASVIPVDAKKDDTLEVPVVDNVPPAQPADSSGAVKIPVQGPEDG